MPGNGLGIVLPSVNRGPNAACRRHDSSCHPIAARAKSICNRAVTTGRDRMALHGPLTYDRDRWNLVPRRERTMLRSLTLAWLTFLPATVFAWPPRLDAQ